MTTEAKHHADNMRMGGGDFVGHDKTVRGDQVGSDKLMGDRITTGQIEGVGIAIGTGASVQIYGDVDYYPVKLRAPLRELFDPLIEDRIRLFGGRDDALNRIAEFIRDPAGGYLVVTALAGFGKTALMTNLVWGTPEAFAYHFFTSTYVSDGLSEDFFLRNVVEQLAQWHGHKGLLPSTLHELSALYHKLLDEPLERTQVLVLDGLDEVTIWKPNCYLSRHLPPNLHIILTVRDVGQDWVTEYGLPADQTKHLPLGGLTRDEVAQVLRAAGRGSVVFADDPALLDEVMRVSVYETDEALGADPFYVRLLAEDAASGDLTPDDIADQPRGLSAYLDTWWQEIRKLAGDEPARDLFGTLTVALGPIQRADLEVINPSLVDAWARDFFDDVLHRVRRWVVGDATHGYALVHPRLRQYMHARIKTDPYREKLLAYCADWQEHHSSYSLRYYAQHLAEAGQLAVHLEECDHGDLYALVESPAWTAAKYVDTPWAASLVQDLHRAAAVASRRDITDLARSMGYQLRRALIERQMGGVSYRAILFLARLGQVERALDFARRHRQQFDLMSEIAQIVFPTWPEKARDIWTEMAHLFDDRGSLQQCQARLVAAQEILLLAPSFSLVALDLIEEAKGLENAISESDWPEYRTDWELPTFALSDDVGAALEASRELPSLERARALRRIPLALPQDHPSKTSLVEQALSALESLERTPQVANERMKAIVSLLPFVGGNRRKELLDSLEAAGDYLQSAREPTQYNWTQAWAIERVAKIDLEWAKRMLFESDWRGALDAWYEVVREIARVDYEEALRLVKDRFADFALRSKLLTDIIGIVALEDVDRAQGLIKEYTKQLKDDMPEAYLALAEGHLARGDAQEAQKIFDEQVFVSDDEGLVHAREDLQLAILARAGMFLSVEVARDRLMQFPGCPRCHRSKEQEAKRILACIAARQDRIDFLAEHRFNPEAQLAAAHDLTDYVSPKAARGYLASQHITSTMKGANKVYAHIAIVEAQQDPTKLEMLLKHFDDGGQAHHFCDHMTALPNALCTLVRDGKIEARDAKAIIERIFSFIDDWQCPNGDRSHPHRLLGGRCACYDRRDQVLVHLIGIMARLDPDRSKEMVNSLPAQPIKVYALKQILHHTRADESLIEEIIDASQECMEDPWLRAGSHYDLALLLSSEMGDWIRRLIGLAEPLLDQKPIREVSEFGIRTRVGPSRTELKIRKAQALIKLVSSVDQLDEAEGAWRIMEMLAQLKDKLRILGVLIEQAMEWSEEDRLALLRHVCEIATGRDWMDVQAFLAFSIPLVNSLGGEDAFWRLYEYVEWAYGLPQVSQPQEGRV